MKINDAFAINVLARKLAIDGVKARLKSQGKYKPWLPFRRMAVEYFAEHEAALVAQAKVKWEAIRDDGHRGRNQMANRAAVRSTAS